MSDMAVRVDISSLAKDLDADVERMREEIERTMRIVAVEMRGYARINAPVRKPINKGGRMVSHTGGLKSSITSKVVTDEDGITAFVGTNKKYAPYVEFGTGDRGMMAGGDVYKGHHVDISYTAGWPGMVPQEYLRPALYDKETEFISKIDSAVRRSLR